MYARLMLQSETTASTRGRPPSVRVVVGYGARIQIETKMFTAKFKRNVNLVIKETPIPSLVLNPQSNNHLAKLRRQMTEVNILLDLRLNILAKFFFIFLE